MENQYNQWRPPANSGKRFWHIWGPFLINWGIGIAISITATMIFIGMYSASHRAEVMEAYNNQKAMMEIINHVLEITQRYAVGVQGIAAMITILVMAFLYHRDRVREKTYGAQRNRKAPAVQYIWIIIFAGTLNFVLNNLIMIGNLSGYSASYEEIAEVFYSPSLGIQLLCLGILTPTAEELVFRGLMYRRMREDTGFVAAMVYTAMVFGVFHGNLVQMVYGFIMGLMLAYVCEKYGSVAAPITAHIAVNIVSILATYSQIYNWMMGSLLIVGVITVGCAVIAASAFLVIRGIDESPEKGSRDTGGQGV